MKILILLTRFNTDPFTYDPNSTVINRNYLLPIGLAYISAVLKQNGYDVTVLNPNHVEGLMRDVIWTELKRQHYDIVFTGGVSAYYPNIRDYIKFIREVSPDTKIVVGGGVMSAQPEIMFKLLKPDFGVIGEGEQTCLELVQCIEKSENPYFTNGIIYTPTQSGYTLKPCITKPREPIKDLDLLPYPDFDAFGIDEFLEHMTPYYIAYDMMDNPRPYPILGSRSCPLACTFCYHTVGNKYRQRSIKSIIDEVQHAVTRYHANIFFFYDELFTYDEKRGLEFCAELRKVMDSTPYKIYINLNLRVDCATDKLLDALKSVNCTIVGLGIESYSQTVLTSMKKHTTPAEIKKVLIMIRDKGLAAQGSFIFGDRAETLATAKETLDFYHNEQDIIRGGISVGFIIPFQGSPVYKECVTKGIIKDEIAFIEDRARNGYDFYSPYNLTDLLDKDFETLKGWVLGTTYTVGKYEIPYALTDGSLETRCPYCGKLFVVKNVAYPKPMGIINAGCRHCNGRFKMVSGWYPYIRLAVNLLGFNNAYWLKKKLHVFA